MASFNEDLLVTRTEQDIFIFKNSNINQANSLKINGKEINEDFVEFEDIPLWRGEIFGICESNYILIPYRTSNNGIANNSPSFAILEIGIDSDELSINSILTFEENLFSTFTSTSRLQGFKEFFFALIGNSTYRIDKGGLKKVNDSMSTIFIHDDKLNSIYLNTSLNKIAWIESGDSGINWSQKALLENLPALRLANFVSVDNRVIGFDGIDIFEVNLIGSEVKLNYLQNNNLEGGSITSILDIGEKVLVTTVCNGTNTNCGAFVKSKKDFFLPIK